MTTSTAEAHLPVDVWNRGFAAVYPPVIKLVEAGGVGAARRAVVGRASGRTLEIGAGAGHALPFFVRGDRAHPDRARRLDAAASGAPGGEDEPSGTG